MNTTTRRVPVVVAQSYFAKIIAEVEMTPAWQEQSEPTKPQTKTSNPERERTFRKKATMHHELTPIEARALRDEVIATEVRKHEWD